jgi:hypothetical protein
MSCSECSSICEKVCCLRGVTVMGNEIIGIMKSKNIIEEELGISSENWFSQVMINDEYPYGFYTRTQVRNGQCVFYNNGCVLHRYAFEKGFNYRLLKPMFSCLFPLHLGEGLLRPSIETRDKELVCQGSGKSLYESGKEDIRYFFGDAIVKELDEMAIMFGKSQKIVASVL